MRKLYFKLIIASIFLLKLSASEAADLHIQIDPVNSQASKVVIPAQVTFDFSKDGPEGIALKISKQLAKYAVANRSALPTTDELGLSGTAIVQNTDNNLKVDIAYLALSSITAIFRAKSTQYPKLAALFADDNAVYNSFVKILPQIEFLEANFSDFGDLQKCNIYVASIMEKTLPMLMDALVAQTPMPLLPISSWIVSSYQDEITNDMLAALTPEIANILNLSYQWVFKLEQIVEAEVQVVKKEIANGNYKYLAYAALGVGAISFIAALARYGFGSGTTAASNSKK